MTDGYQEPFTYGSLPGKDIYLLPPTKVAIPADETEKIEKPTAAQRMMQDFLSTSETDTIDVWTGFLSKYADQQDQPLMKIAGDRVAALIQAAL